MILFAMHLSACLFEMTLWVNIICMWASGWVCGLWSVVQEYPKSIVLMYFWVAQKSTNKHINIISLFADCHVYPLNNFNICLKREYICIWHFQIRYLYCIIFTIYGNPQCVLRTKCPLAIRFTCNRLYIPIKINGK